jgi:hypothetical protein
MGWRLGAGSHLLEESLKVEQDARPSETRESLGGRRSERERKGEIGTHTHIHTERGGYK